MDFFRFHKNLNITILLQSQQITKKELQNILTCSLHFLDFHFMLQLYLAASFIEVVLFLLTVY